MAIEFKSAPASQAPEEQTEFDILAVLEDGGQMNLIMLIIAVVIIYGIVTYLRTTPGYRLTDIRLKRDRRKAAVRRTGSSDAESREAAEQR